MAYNNYFPATYQPYQAYQQYQNYQPIQQNTFQTGNIPQQIQPQIQNGGFVTVRSWQEAFNYPVAPGNSVTFKDETSPFIYVKTKGFSQLEEPIFEKFRLVKEDENQQQVTQVAATSVTNEQGVNYLDFAKQADLAILQSEIELLKKQVAELTVKPEKAIKKKEADVNV